MSDIVTGGGIKSPTFGELETPAEAPTASTPAPAPKPEA